MAIRHFLRRMCMYRRTGYRFRNTKALVSTSLNDTYRHLVSSRTTINLPPTTIFDKDLGTAHGVFDTLREIAGYLDDEERAYNEFGKSNF